MAFESMWVDHFMERKNNALELSILDYQLLTFPMVSAYDVYLEIAPAFATGNTVVYVYKHEVFLTSSWE